MLLRICLLALASSQLALASPSDGKDIADRFGEDLSFASKQVIRGFTAIFAPILDTAQSIPKVLNKAGGRSSEAETQSFPNVLLRDGLNAIGKGVKATATILSSPARVAGTGLDEIRKAGQAGVDARLGTDAPPSADRPMDDRTKIVSTLLNTTSSEFSQANLGAVLVEVAVKNRIKDFVNQTASGFVPKKLEVERTNVEKRESPGETEKEEISTTTSRVDVLLDRFKEAVKRNDDKLQEALKELLKRINPPKE